MISFIRNIPRHLKEGFIGLFRHLLMGVSAMMTITITLIIISAFSILIANVNDFTYQVESDVQIHVKIMMEASDEQITKLGEEIEYLDHVKNVEFSSREEELEKFMAAFGDDGKMFEIYSGENNPFRNAFIVSIDQGENLEDVAANIKMIDNVEEVNYGGSNIVKMIEGFKSLRNGLMILIIGLVVLAVLLISNTIKLTIANRSREIEIMKTVGASNSFIRTPFLIEGMLIGLFGSIIPIILTYYGYSYLYETFNGAFFSAMFVMKPIFPFVYQIFALLIGIGLCVGFIGSYFSTGKYLRRY